MKAIGSFCVGLLTLAAVGPSLNTAAMAGCNSGDSANTRLLTSSQCEATATGINSTAVGAGAFSVGQISTAFGVAASAWALGATTIGAYTGPDNDHPAEGITVVGGYAGISATNYSISVGANSRGEGVYSIAVGAGDVWDFDPKASNAARAGGANSIAIGSGDSNYPGAASAGYRSIAIGQKSLSANFGTSVGFNTSTAFASTAVGTDASASGDSSTAVGRFSSANGPSSTALGVASQAKLANSLSLGNSALAGGNSSAALGYNSLASALNSIAFGPTSHATAPYSIAMGYAAAAPGPSSVAIGQLSAANATASISYGAGATAAAASSVAIGTSSQAAGSVDSVAVGHNASASQDNSSAFGAFSFAKAAGGSAIGSAAVASATSSVAVGANSAAGGDGTAIGAIAIGANAQATKAKAVAIGSGSLGDVSNAVSVGWTGHERRIVHVAAAVKPTDAVNLAQVQAMFAAIGAVAKSDSTTGKTQLASLGRDQQRGTTVAPSDPRNSNDFGNTTRSGSAQASSSSSRTCQFSASRMTATADHQTLASTAFGRIERSGISFDQTEHGCVALTFSTEAALNRGNIEVKAVLDGEGEIMPWARHTGSDDQMHTFSFIFLEVAPGPHRIELHARRMGGAEVVRLGSRSSALQYVK